MANSLPYRRALERVSSLSALDCSYCLLHKFKSLWFIDGLDGAKRSAPIASAYAHALCSVWYRVEKRAVLVHLFKFEMLALGLKVAPWARALNTKNSQTIAHHKVRILFIPNFFAYLTLGAHALARVTVVVLCVCVSVCLDLNLLLQASRAIRYYTYMYKFSYNSVAASILSMIIIESVDYK